MVSASRGVVQFLQLLLDKGADVNHQDKVSSFHHEMKSLPLVHVYHVPLYEWSISSEVSLISPPSFHYFTLYSVNCGHNIDISSATF